MDVIIAVTSLMPPKHPVILPGRSPVVERMVRHHHLEVGHMGYELSTFCVKKILLDCTWDCFSGTVSRECIVCRKLCGRPGQTLMSAVPYEQVRANWGGQLPPQFMLQA